MTEAIWKLLSPGTGPTHVRLTNLSFAGGICSFSCQHGSWDGETWTGSSEVMDDKSGSLTDFTTEGSLEYSA